MRAEDYLTLESIRSSGKDDWGWPTHLILTLRTPDGEEVEAVVQIDQWRNPKNKAQSE